MAPVRNAVGRPEQEQQGLSDPIQEHFDQPSFWRSADERSPHERERVQSTAMLVGTPSSLLDVGCGDGRLLDAVPGARLSVGVDYSIGPLRLWMGNRCQTTGSALPFADSSFDTVVCTEVLEHLPPPIYELSLREIERVAKSTVVLSVPFEENLRVEMIQCPSCKFEFHAWGHVRTFSMDDLRRIFSTFSIADTVLCGPRVKRPVPALLWFQQKALNRRARWDHGLCPECGCSFVSQPPENVLTRSIEWLNRRISRLRQDEGQPRWIVAKYERRRSIS
jgi:ubiquinone/menaquinone biosynthesis C-methylase UbiE